MGLTAFLEALFAHGRVEVIPGARDDAPDEVRRVLRSAESIRRPNMPGHPPGFTLEAAEWAAQLFYAACQLLVFRAEGEEEVEAAFSRTCPGAASASRDYSVDLVLQYLPGLHERASRTAPADPLVQRLLLLARDWPLSSVGVPGVQANLRDSEVVLADPCLLQLYVDRILARGDATRLGNSRVDQAVRQALGAFSHLAPGMAAQLPT